MATNEDTIARALNSVLTLHDLTRRDFENRFEELNGHVKTLSKIVRDGNGEPSLMVKVRALESSAEGFARQLVDYQEEMDRVRVSVEDIQSAEKDEVKIRSARRWEIMKYVLILILGGALTYVGSLAKDFIDHSIRPPTYIDSKN